MEEKLAALLEEAVDGVMDEVIAFRRQLHRRPELGFETFETMELISKILTEAGIGHKTHCAESGVVARIPSKGSGHKLALRGDIDALPVTEQTSLPFASEIEGRMHACGHDNHAAIALGSALVLNRLQGRLPGETLVVFQPAEEGPTLPTGARRIMAEGHLDGVREIYGLHVSNELLVGQIGCRCGNFMASADMLNVKFTGKASHAAYPHKGVDALLVACRFVDAVQTVVSRMSDPLEPIVISFGRMIAGEAGNVLAGEAQLWGTMRTYNKELQRRALAAIEQMANETAAMYGATAEVKITQAIGSVVNDKRTTQKLERVARELLGEEQVVALENPSMGGEDFSGYLDAIPGTFYNLGTSDGVNREPLHSSTFDVDERALRVGVRLMCALALDPER